MAFTHRTLEPKDLKPCLALTREGFVYSASERAQLFSLWTELLKSKACISVVIEDRRLAPGQRVVAFGMSVFATDKFSDRLLKGLPFSSRAFLQQWEKGEPPFLTPKDIGAANAGAGLNLLILHFGWDMKKLTEADMQKVQHLQTERFVQQHAGYKTKEYLQEVYGPQLRDFVLSAGSVLRHDYGGTKWKKSLSGISGNDWPYLVGFRPEEAIARAGTAASMLQAKSVPPRFRLAPSEQEMLNLALLGKTDEELAKALDLSHWTVKKRWQSIYLKVKKADPDLLGPPSTKEKNEGGRNRQRRRYLLEYLRHHPEELRPRSSKSGTRR